MVSINAISLLASDSTIWVQTSSQGVACYDGNDSSDSDDEAGGTGDSEFGPELMKIAYNVLIVTDEQMRSANPM